MTQEHEADGRSVADTDPSDDALRVTSGSILLASARARFAVAASLSLALWVGYFWATATPTLP